MPHKMFQPDDFKQKCQELRERFEVGAQDSLFLSDSEQKNIPTDGVPIFISQTWSVIRDQKDLNLPDQREIVANYRCNEIKEDAFKQVDSDIVKLQSECNLKVVEGFKTTCESIITKALEFYANASKQYDKNVVSKIKDELSENINKQLYLCFDSQLTMIRNYTYDKVNGDIRKLEKRSLDETAHQLAKILNTLIDGNMKSYEKKVNALIMAGSGWDVKVSLSTKELDS